MEVTELVESPADQAVFGDATDPESVVNDEAHALATTRPAGSKPAGSKGEGPWACYVAHQAVPTLNPIEMEAVDGYQDAVYAYVDLFCGIGSGAFGCKLAKMTP